MKVTSFATGQTFGIASVDQPLPSAVLDALRRCPDATIWRDTGAVTVPRGNEQWLRDMLIVHGVEVA